MATKLRLVFVFTFLFSVNAWGAWSTLAVDGRYVKVHLDFPGGKPVGQLAKSQIYVDAPTLLWRGSWLHPDVANERGVSPVPELIAPVRVILPGVYKFFETDSTTSTHGEIFAETFTPEARIYRLYLPITALHRTIRYEIEFHAGLKVPVDIVIDFKPQAGLVVRNSQCEKSGIDFEYVVENFKEGSKAAPNLVYIFCADRPEEVEVGLYAPLDLSWSRFGHQPRRTYEGRGLYFKLPKPERGVYVPQTITEFDLETKDGFTLPYVLRFNPPWRPRRFESLITFGPAFSTYNESRRNLEISQISFYGKLSAQLKLWPKGFDVYGDIGGSIVDGLLSENGNGGSYRFYHANARAGYVSQNHPGISNWSLMFGWHWWRMFPDNSKYGLETTLAGPQLFFQYRFDPIYGPKSGSSWWWNMHGEILGRNVAPDDTRSYGLGAGAGYEILWVGKRRPLFLTLDLSRESFSFQDTSQVVYNAILGVAYRLY